jgi:AcrR family transcriptional regulator
VEVAEVSERPAGTRRRGAALEALILDAAWDELGEAGYAGLTMEGVAARARTGKQVLYRRWRNRAELVIAALRHRTGSITDRIPDTGSLREDVLAVLRHAARRQREIGPDVIRGLMADAPDLGPEFPAVMGGVMTTILERAAARGEIPSARLHPRVVTLAADLVRHEMLLSRDGVGEGALVEIADEVFLPLVRAAAVAPE